MAHVSLHRVSQSLIPEPRVMRRNKIRGSGDENDLCCKTTKAVSVRRRHDVKLVSGDWSSSSCGESHSREIQSKNKSVCENAVSGIYGKFLAPGLEHYYENVFVIEEKLPLYSFFHCMMMKRF